MKNAKLVARAIEIVKYERDKSWQGQDGSLVGDAAKPENRKRAAMWAAWSLERKLAFLFQIRLEAFRALCK